MRNSDPTCITCGTTLAHWEVKLNKNNMPIPNQKCIQCKKAGLTPSATDWAYEMLYP